MRLFQLGTFHNNAEADMAVRKWLRMEETDFTTQLSFLNSCQDGTNSLMCYETMFENNNNNSAE